jgi:hypothetical protein
MNAAHLLQCARWDVSILIDEQHEFWECGSEGAACEVLHDVQRNISRALTELGHQSCRTPFPYYVDYRPEGWVEPLHPDEWYAGGAS